MRSVAASLLAIFVGFWGLAGLMGDLGPGESAAGRVAYLGALFVGGALAVGLLAGRRWWLGLLCAWAPLVMVLAGLARRLSGAGAANAARAAAVELEHLIQLAFALPLSLGAAWLGSRLGRRLGWAGNGGPARRAGA